MARKITATKCPPQKCNFYTFLLFYCPEIILQNSRYSAVEVASLNYLRYVCISLAVAHPFPKTANVVASHNIFVF